MYTLTLTDEDMQTIRFVGHRYSWSDCLLHKTKVHAGVNNIPEHKAWELSEAFDMDTEGGHSYFPMLDPRSDLAEKLFKFMQSII